MACMTACLAAEYICVRSHCNHTSLLECWLLDVGYVNGLFPILGVCFRQGLTLADCSSRFPSQNPITNSAPQLYTQNL